MRKGVKVRRVVRRFELWPVAKVAFFFHLLCYLLTLGVLTGIWFVADRMGTVQNLEKLVSRLGWEKFEVHGDVLFESAALIGASLVVVATIATVTLAFFYNMLSGIFGGLVLSVLQEHADGSSRSRRQRRLAAKAAAKAAAKGNSSVRELGNTSPAAVPPRAVPVAAPLTSTAGTATTPRTVSPSASPVRVSAAATPAPIPEDWEPDTVRSLFGDGDLEEDFNDGFDEGFDEDFDGDFHEGSSQRS
jgi:Transmembrane domain of unknown function (DUF3566)